MAAILSLSLVHYYYIMSLGGEFSPVTIARSDKKMHACTYSPRLFSMGLSDAVLLTRNEERNGVDY